MWEKALEIASHINHPEAVAAFSAVLAAITLGLSLRAKKPRIAAVLATGIIVLGAAPLASSVFLQSRGIYRVRVVVLGLDKFPVDDAQVISSNGGEQKKIEGGCEFDILPQLRPADGKLKLFASEKNAFLAGIRAALRGMWLLSRTSATKEGRIWSNESAKSSRVRISAPARISERTPAAKPMAMSTLLTGSVPMMSA